MTDEYEDNESILGDDGEESHTFVTQFDPRKHQSAPLPEGTAEHVKNELNSVEKHLDLMKTAQNHDIATVDDDFTETVKEQQARKLLEMQFAQASEKPTIGTPEQDLE
jgi:hypothetical protein